MTCCNALAFGSLPMVRKVASTTCACFGILISNDSSFTGVAKPCLLPCVSINDMLSFATGSTAGDVIFPFIVTLSPCADRSEGDNVKNRK
ncbi:hypothetical protein D3C72_1926980 [compost metagenome]